MKRLNDKKRDVLFQKLGNTWYVFSEINDDLIYSALPNGVDPKSTNIELFELIEEHLNKVAGLSERSKEIGL